MTASRYAPTETGEAARCSRAIASGSILTVKAFRPFGLRPAPLRLPPLFDFDDVIAPSGVPFDAGSEGNQSFTAQRNNFSHQSRRVSVIVADDASAVALNPISAPARMIKGDELNSGPMDAADANRITGLPEPSAPSPKLTGHRLARHGLHDPARNINHPAVSGPKPHSIPFATAAVEFLGEIPAGQVFTRPVNSVHHFGFGHVKNVARCSLKSNIEIQWL